jgi:hypothetical protein
MGVLYQKRRKILSKNVKGLQNRGWAGFELAEFWARLNAETLRVVF